MLKFALLGSCFSDLFTEVQMWYYKNFKSVVQSWKKYIGQTLVFLYNREIRENFNFCFWDYCNLS